MQHRALGRTGLAVSALTLGTGALARADRNEAVAVIARALDRGVNSIELDAADERAMALLGEALATHDRRDEVHLLVRARSLVPFALPSPHVPVEQAYPGARLRADVEGVLRALRIERLGVLQLHAWCPEWLDEGDWRTTLQDLRAEGKIAATGISLFDHDIDAAATAVQSAAVDAVQVMLNIFDQAALAALLPECRRQGIGVIARAPLYYGALADGVDLAALAPQDWRHAYFYPDHAAEVAGRVARLAGLGGPGTSLAALALRFCLTPPGVSTVAMGLRTRAQLEQALQAVEDGALPQAVLQQLRGHAWLC